MRAAGARDTAAQAEDTPFQAVLAQELGLLPGGGTAPAQGAPSAAADSSVKPGEDAAQSAAIGDAPLPPAYAGVILFPPVSSGAYAVAPVAAGVSVAPPLVGGAPGSSQILAGAPGTLPISAGAPGPSPIFAGAPLPLLAAASVSAAAAAGASASPTAAGGASPRPAAHTSAGAAGAAHQHLHAHDAAGANAEFQLPAVPAATDGKLPPSAAAEFRRETAFDTSVLDHHQALATAAAIHGGSAPAPQLTHAAVAALDARVGERGWDQGLGDKLIWMAGQKHSVAELHLNPPDLGPLKITLTLNDDQASAQFVSAHAQVREALEAAMPRLREMLADSGITLGNADVSADAFREHAQPQSQPQPRAYAESSAANGLDPGVLTRGERLLRQTHGLVDTFA